jgi:hypothetical protein
LYYIPFLAHIEIYVPNPTQLDRLRWNDKEKKERKEISLLQFPTDVKKMGENGEKWRFY